MCGPTGVTWGRAQVWVCCMHASVGLHCQTHAPSSAISLWLLCAFLCMVGNGRPQTLDRMSAQVERREFEAQQEIPASPT